MISYTRLNVLVISFIITMPIFLFLNYFILDYQNSINIYNQIKWKHQEEQPKEVLNETNIINNSEADTKNVVNATKSLNKTSYITYNENIWRLIIPKIGLEADIAEGTTDGVMNKFIGHFENTSIVNGNVALAAHNRGYPVNYFRDLKSLQSGDVIEYIAKGIKKEYKVETIAVIKDTDWSYLKSTKDNRITLITCVENEPDYRRCIQGVEI